jgi:hypothetical protein
MRLKSTPCEGAAVDQGINVPLTPFDFGSCGYVKPAGVQSPPAALSLSAASGFEANGEAHLLH